MPSTALLDACGRRRSPATLPSFHQGRPPRNKGQLYPADPPTVEEIVAVMHAAGDDNDAVRLRGLIVVLWRAGLRISEALALNESDLDVKRGAILVRHGKGGKRREVGMDRWAWEQLGPWLQLRTALPVGALFCVLRRPTAGRAWAPAGARSQLHLAAAQRGRTASVRAPSVAPRARGRDVTRRGAAARHPAAARPRRPRDHLGVSARDRQHRDCARRPRTASADDPSDSRPIGRSNQRGRPRNASSASQVGACARGPIRMRPPSASCLTDASSPSFCSRDCWTWARSTPVTP